MTHLDVFRANGFHFDADDSQPAGHKLKLTAVPFSKGTQFGDEGALALLHRLGRGVVTASPLPSPHADIHELASLLLDSPGQMVRLPKATAMFASRACRSAVMIGTPLTRDKMQSIVRGMAALDQPWNCPHGYSLRAISAACCCFCGQSSHVCVCVRARRRPTMRHLFDVSIVMPKASTT